MKCLFLTGHEPKAQQRTNQPVQKPVNGYAPNGTLILNGQGVDNVHQTLHDLANPSLCPSVFLS